ncbi:DUF2798 domain-containing protein [Halomonas beimenensis]|uniref:DUF2798 domain-containing protein n=1 Tax=Halomonas beimenensis TaxID=475662 RepID=A0A291P4Z4_9GAMM|nr:DUF2798 domain-containing protein [Halomonas beimenensis]ATJ81941.1 hypothetical protein BEI_0954 [Halomonas beimenensis]
MSPPASSRSSHSAPRRRRGLPPRWAPVVFAFYMSALMTLLMCLVITAVTGGWGPHYLETVAKAYVRAMPVAFLGVLLIRPLVTRLVRLTVAETARSEDARPAGPSEQEAR